MSDYEYEVYEEEHGENTEDDSEYVSEYAGIHRAMLLLIIVLAIGIVLLGLFMVTRPAPVIVPTLKPPWLV